jgi:hypothetical protein
MIAEPLMPITLEISLQAYYCAGLKFSRFKSTLKSCAD